MIDMLKRHDIQALRRAEHSWNGDRDADGRVGVSTAQRVVAEDAVRTVDNAAERARRQVRRPSKAEAYREVMVRAMTEQPDVRSVELLHRAGSVMSRGRVRHPPKGLGTRKHDLAISRLRVCAIT